MAYSDTSEIRAIDDAQEREIKRQKAWDEVLEAREEHDDLKSPILSPTDQKIKEISSVNLTPNQLSVQSKISDKTIDLTDKINVKNPQINLNPQYENVKLAAKIDHISSQKILKKCKDIQDKIDLQKQLLSLKNMLPKKEKEPLSTQAQALIEKINKEHNQNNFPPLDATSDVLSLKGQIESILDSLKLEIQHGFSMIQQDNHERLSIFNLVSKMRSEIDLMVRNQKP